MYDNPLRTIVALLAVAPQPLSTLEIAVVVGKMKKETELNLKLLKEAGRVTENGDMWELRLSKDVLAEAVSEVRRQARRRELDRIALNLQPQPQV